MIADAHPVDALLKSVGIFGVVVPDQVARSVVPGKGFPQLAGNLFSGRMSCHPEPDQLPPQVP